MTTMEKRVNLAFMTIKIPTSICLEKAALMVQRKVSRILSVNFRIPCNAMLLFIVLLTLEVEQTMRSEILMAAYILLTTAVSKIGSIGKSISKVLSNLIGLSL